MTDYERDTLNAYRSRARAVEYKRFHTTGWTWGRFITYLEQRAVARELKRYEWSSADQVLDIPCGTGILGKLFRRFPFRIVASDISVEMMEHARAEYPADRLISLTQADITATPFPRNSFSCVVTLGFLHRVPPEIKRSALREIYALSNRLAIVSCSVDDPTQRLKHSLLSIIKGNHVPAPCPLPLSDIVGECEAAGFRVIRAFKVLPLVSAHALLVLEK